MSSDNGIYIVKFPDGYRVTHAQAIENIDYYKVGSFKRKQMLLDYFGDSPLFADKDAAFLYAHALMDELDASGFSLEYGICYLGEYEGW